jgi:hypothetical protein
MLMWHLPGGAWGTWCCSGPASILLVHAVCGAACVGLEMQAPLLSGPSMLYMW